MPTINQFAAPMKVLKFSNDDEMSYDVNSLEKLFKHPSVKNRQIVVFSITGAYRNGKSFFLNYCLRYLYANYPSIKCPTVLGDPTNWMGAEDEPLEGFSWRGGSIRDTAGILVWDDVFLHSIKDEEIAIVVFDMQGLFDTETTERGNARISALGNLVSSIQVLNTANVIQQNLLHYFQFTIEFAKFTSDGDHEDSLFQNLIFLFRDWKNPGEYEYGIEGGEEYLDTFLSCQKKHAAELNSGRKFIKNSFDKLECALLPHPGNKVANFDKRHPYDGNWKDMDLDFKVELEKLIDYLLKPKNLVVKKISGVNIKASAFVDYMINIFKLFQSDTLPLPQTIHEAMIQQQMKNIVDTSFELYKKTLFTMEKDLKAIPEIEGVHKTSCEEAMQNFENSKKMGDQNHIEKFKILLKELIAKHYDDWSSKLKQKIQTELENQAMKENQAVLEKTINETKTEQQLRSVVDDCFDLYKKSLIKTEPNINDFGNIENCHNSCLAEAVVSFQKSEKMGDDAIIDKFKTMLKNMISSYFIEWNMRMQEKIKKDSEHQELKNNQEKIKEEAEIERQLKGIVEECFHLYKNALKRREQNLKKASEIDEFHTASFNKAIANFDESEKMGNNQHQREHKKILKNMIEKFFDEWNILMNEKINWEIQNQKINTNLKNVESSLQQAKAEQEMKDFSDLCVEYYKSSLIQMERNIKEVSQIQEIHSACLRQALLKFESSNIKIDNFENYSKKFESMITTHFNEWSARMHEKIQRDDDVIKTQMILQQQIAENKREYQELKKKYIELQQCSIM